MSSQAILRKQLLALAIQLVLALGLQVLNIYTAQFESWAWFAQSVVEFVLLFALVAAVYQSKIRSQQTRLVHVFVFFVTNLVVDLVFVVVLPSLFMTV